MFPKPVADTTLGQNISFAIRAGDLGCAVGVKDCPCGYVGQHVRCPRDSCRPIVSSNSSASGHWTGAKPSNVQSLATWKRRPDLAINARSVPATAEERVPEQEPVA
jgi:hypothetical protein